MIPIIDYETRGTLPGAPPFYLVDSSEGLSEILANVIICELEEGAVEGVAQDLGVI